VKTRAQFCRPLELLLVPVQQAMPLATDTMSALQKEQRKQ